MHATFSVRCHPTLDLLEISMAGFFGDADIAAFDRRRRDEMAKLACPAGQHRTLVDIAGMDVQSQAAVAAFGRLLADPRSHSHRLAFVVRRSLARTQVIRALGGREARHFESRAEARRWLLVEQHTAAA